MTSPNIFMVIFRSSYFAIFVGMHAALMLGLFLEWLREKKVLNVTASKLPSVSIIIPIHNESRRIEMLLKSLELQDYPGAELIFVNDRSSDESFNLIAGFLEGNKWKSSNVRIVTLTENPGPNFKQYALAMGIRESHGDFLLFTDADCEIGPGWIEAMVKRMSDSRIGVAIAPVFKRTGKKGFLHLYQCFEHGIRYIYLAGATGLGAAGGGFGNNLILRRSALDDVGGYEKVPPSPTEDAALISMIRSGGKYTIRAALGRDVHVITHGEETWKDLVTQTLRWNNGGLFSPDFVTRVNYGFLMITIGMGVISIPLLPFIPSLWPVSIGLIFSMALNTIANLGLFSASLPKAVFGYILTLYFTPAYFTYLTILGFLGIKPKWKGKTV